MKYSIITYGCQMNKADSERIAAILENKGYKLSLKNRADLIVINMCSVRQSAVDRVYGLIPKLKKLKEKNPKLKTVLTGCILNKDKKLLQERFDEIWGNKNYLKTKSKYGKNYLAYVPISNGCNNFCTYCVVPFTRGPLLCRNHKETLKEIKRNIEQGAKEIWLLGQNVNDYNSPANKKIDFPILLKMVSDLPGNFKIKFTSSNPKNFSDSLINVMAQSKKIAHYLNLPLQSGDNLILKRMNRPYTVAKYKDIIKKIRKIIPDIFLSTDIIVGFPGETKKQFLNTVKVFKEIDFDMAYISKFSPRPGTVAFKMNDDIPKKEKERRWNFLNDILLKKWKRKKTVGTKKIVVILGPTSSGKSELAVELAKKFNGEVISADSRQVYKGLDIGTGKITKKERKGIRHHLLDVANPKRRFTVVQYKKLALKAIEKIFENNKTPIICGGTAFYIEALIKGIIIPEIKPDWRLRSNLERLSTSELFNKLKKSDPKRAKIIDKKNRRRLIRALEIVIKTKKTVPTLKTNPLPYPVLTIGIKKEKAELKKLISKRLLKRLKQGMVKEVKKLRKFGLSWKRLEGFGLEYRFVAQYLQKKISYGEMVNLIQKESEHFAKRQMTWFKKDEQIEWIKNYKEAESQVKKFL